MNVAPSQDRNTLPEVVDRELAQACDRLGDEPGALEAPFAGAVFTAPFWRGFLICDHHCKIIP